MKKITTIITGCAVGTLAIITGAIGGCLSTSIHQSSTSTTSPATSSAISNSVDAKNWEQMNNI